MLPITLVADSPSAPAIALRIAIIAVIHLETFPGLILSFDMIFAILDLTNFSGFETVAKVCRNVKEMLKKCNI